MNRTALPLLLTALLAWLPCASASPGALHARHRVAGLEQRIFTAEHWWQQVAPLLEDGTAEDLILDPAQGHGVLGEIVVSAPHLKDRYDALWHTDQQSKRDGLWRRDGRVWHRTADIGHFDAEGRVWLEGRLQHVITTPEGPLGPGGPEKTVDALGPVRRSAVVGVGPRGTQAVVVVVEAAVPMEARMRSGVPMRRTGFLPSVDDCDCYQ